MLKITTRNKIIKRLVKEADKAVSQKENFSIAGGYGDDINEDSVDWWDGYHTAIQIACEIVDELGKEV